MGKGDRRSRRGKIWNGSFGKFRLKASKLRRMKAGSETTPAKSKAGKKAKKA